MLVGYGGTLTAVSDIVQNNETGVQVMQKSALRATFDLTITNNREDRVLLLSGSTAAFQQSNTGNLDNRESSGDGSFS